MKKWKYGGAVVGLVLSFLLSSMVSGLTVLQLNLEQLTVLSEKVFVGRCISVREREDKDGRPVQYITFDVLETLKGPPQEKVTFKQLGLTERQLKGENTIEGVFRELPRYEIGEEVVLFLSGEGGLGFTAPVGLHQGKFKVFEEEGQKQVMNGTRNAGLFLGMQKSPRTKSLILNPSEKNLLKSNKKEDVSYTEFVSLVKKLAEAE